MRQLSDGNAVSARLLAPVHQSICFELVNIHKEQTCLVLIIFEPCNSCMQASLDMSAVADSGQWISMDKLAHFV